MKVLREISLAYSLRLSFLIRRSDACKRKQLQIQTISNPASVVTIKRVTYSLKHEKVKIVPRDTKLVFYANFTLSYHAVTTTITNPIGIKVTASIKARCLSP